MTGMYQVGEIRREQAASQPWRGSARLIVCSMLAYLLLQVGLFLRYGNNDPAAIYFLAALAYVPAILLTGRRTLERRPGYSRWLVFTFALMAAMMEFVTMWLGEIHAVSLAFRYTPALCEVISFSILLLLLTGPARSDTSRLACLVDVGMAVALCLCADAAFLLPHADFTLTEWLTFLTSMRAVLLVSALIALRATRDAEEHWLMQIIAGYQALDLLGSLVLNQGMAQWLHQFEASGMDFMMSVPPLGLTLMLLYARKPGYREPLRSSYVARSGMSLFLSAALAGLGFWMLGRHPALGTGAMVLAVLGFVMRALAVQTHELEVADQLKDSLEQVRGLAQQDALTGLRNRRGFDAALDELIQEGGGAYPVSLVLVDVDLFKTINDTYGHTMGDHCLKLVAQCLERVRRDERDQVCRLGGDEFCILLPQTGLSQASAVGRSIQAMLKASAGELRSLNLTVSVGVGVCGAWNSDARADLIQRADQTLYLAKRHGRNRVRAGMDEEEAGVFTMSGTGGLRG